MMRDFWLAGAANTLPSRGPLPPSFSAGWNEHIPACVFILEVSSFPLHTLHRGQGTGAWWDPQHASIVMGDLPAVLSGGCVFLRSQTGSRSMESSRHWPEVLQPRTRRQNSSLGITAKPGLFLRDCADPSSPRGSISVV